MANHDKPNAINHPQITNKLYQWYKPSRSCQQRKQLLGMCNAFSVLMRISLGAHFASCLLANGVGEVGVGRGGVEQGGGKRSCFIALSLKTESEQTCISLIFEKAATCSHLAATCLSSHLAALGSHSQTLAPTTGQVAAKLGQVAASGC